MANTIYQIAGEFYGLVKTELGSGQLSMRVTEIHDFEYEWDVKVKHKGYRASWCLKSDELAHARSLPNLAKRLAREMKHTLKEHIAGRD